MTTKTERAPRHIRRNRHISQLALDGQPPRVTHPGVATDMLTDTQKSALETFDETHPMSAVHTFIAQQADLARQAEAPVPVPREIMPQFERTLIAQAEQAQTEQAQQGANNNEDLAPAPRMSP